MRNEAKSPQAFGADGSGQQQLTHSGFSQTGHGDTVQPLLSLPERTDLSEVLAAIKQY